MERLLRSISLLAIAVAVTASSSAFAQTTRYWDSNAATAGAGTTPTGTWGTSTFWSTSSAGTAATAAWTSGDTAIFSAGTDATGAWTLTVSGTQTAAGVTVEEGTITQSGGVVDTGAGNFTINSGATWKIASSTQLNSAGKVVLDGGTLININAGSAGSFINAAKGLEITANGGSVGYDDGVGANAFTTIYSGTITGVGGTTANGGIGTLTKVGVDEFRYQAPAAGGTNTANSTFSKLVVKEGLYRLGSVLVSSVQQTSELGLGAAPTAPLADAITLDGGSVGSSFAVVTNANRGIFVTANGGSINTTAAGFTAAGGITGPGALTLSGTGLIITKNATIGQILGANTTTVTVTGSSVILSAGDANNNNFSGLVAGTGQFKKTGAGIMTFLDKDWTNSGATTIDVGTLKFGNAAAGLSSTSAVTITSGATLDMNTANDTIGTLNGGGSVTNGGNLSIAGTAGSFSGSMTLAGTFTKTSTSTGTTVLSGNTTVNKIQVNAGILTLSGSNTVAAAGLNILGVGTLAASSGRVNFNHNNAAGSADVFVTGVGAEISNSAAGITTANIFHLDGGAPASLTDAKFVQIESTSSNSWNITGKITGTGGLIRDNDGAGTLTLSGANDFSGGFYITSRPVVAGSKNAFGAGTLTVGDPSAAPATAIGFSSSTTLSGATAVNNAVAVNQNFSVTGASDLEFSNTVDLAAGTRTITVTNTAATILSGQVTNGALTKAGSTVLTLSNATNNYAGATSVSAGTLVAASNNALGTAAGSTTVTSGAALGFQGGITYSTAEAVSVAGTGVAGAGAINNVSGNNSFAGVITMTADSSIGAAAGSSLTVSNAIGGTANLTKVGSGTVVFSGGNNCIGSTSISAGTLKSAGSGVIPDASAVSLVNTAGAGWDLDGNIETVASLAGGGGTGGNVSLGVGTLTTGSGGSTSYDGVISGGGNVVKEGGTTFTLGGNNTYGGGTTINNGTLLANNATNSTGTGAVLVNSTGTLAGTGKVGGNVNVAGGTVAGSITIAGNLTFNTGTGGTFAPGSSPGTILMSGGSVVFDSATAVNYDLKFDVAQNTGQQTIGGGVSDLLDGAGNLTLAGNLNVTPATGSDPFANASVGTTWRLVNYTGLLAGTLNLGTLPSLAAGLDYQLDTGTSGQINLLVITAIPEASSFLFAGTIGGVLGLGRLVRQARRRG